MTAGFFIATPSPAGPAAVATGLPGTAHGVTGAGAATGFEALLAAFFGNQGTATAQAALLSGAAGQVKTVAAGLGANDNVDDAGKVDAGKADATKIADGQAAAGQTISAEAQALAALMATPVTASVAQASASTPAKTDGAAAAPAAAFAAQKLLSPAAAKAQAAADQTANALAADASAAAKDAAASADITTGSAKPATSGLTAGPTTAAATPTPATPKPAEAVAAPYTPPSPAQTDAGAQKVAPPVAADTPAPAATAADQAAVAAATQTATPAPAPIKAKDLPASHATDRLDTSHRTTSNPPTIDGAASPATIQHPVTAVAPVAGKAGEQASSGEKPLAGDVKLAKVDEGAAATQPAAVAAADHSAQATATTAARATPETVSSLAAQILRKADGRTSRFDVELHPADLGRVDVRLEISATGRMTAAMSFENPQAAAELRGRAHELQAALERAGFDVSGGLTFDVAGDQGQGGQNLAGQQQQPDGGGASRGRAFQAALQSAGDTTAAAHSAAVYGQSRTTSGVDIRI